MTDYIEIRNWDKFQHADATKRGRDPVWIKAYTRLLSDDAYLALSGHRRAILHGLWLEYARSGRRLPNDTRTLTRRLDLRVTRKDLNAIHALGFTTITARAPLEYLSSTVSNVVNDATATDAATKTKDTNGNRQDTDVTPSIREEKREEKKEQQLPTRAREAVDGWSGPGSNVVSFLDERRRSA